MKDNKDKIWTELSNLYIEDFVGDIEILIEKIKNTEMFTEDGEDVKRKLLSILYTELGGA